jgi:hypothetical protein
LAGIGALALRSQQPMNERAGAPSETETPFRFDLQWQ